VAAIAAYRPGQRSRLLYRLMAHRGRKGEPKGFGEAHFAALLDAARQQLGGPIVLVWDGLPAHKSAKMRALIATRPWLRVYQLPGYAPELNPTENIWSSLKRGMANLAVGTINDLHRIARKRLKSMQYQPALADGFLAATGLAPP
jgi:putative transposase